MQTTEELKSELESLRTGAAIFPLTGRAFLRITGPDATRWLNGMVTNNIKDLAPGQGNYNFLLNAQGRIQGDCTIYREPHDAEPTFLLQTDATQVENIHQLLDRYIIMDDVELTVGLTLHGNPASGIALLGATAPELLPKLISSEFEASIRPIPPPGSMTHVSANGSAALLFVPPTTSTRFDLWFMDEKELSIERNIMHRHGITDLSNEAQEALRILSTTPKYGIDIRNTDTNKDLPQETAQTHALNFNKGCYLGQEIVERIHSRGQVHRIFTAFTLTGTLPTLPTPLTSNDKPAGELTSAIRIGDTIHALGYARREFLETKATLTYPGGTATPRAS